MTKTPAAVNVSREFHLGRVLGEGGMGKVFEGFEAGLGQHAAIKVLRPEHAGDAEVSERFSDEALLMASIEHPGCLPIYGWGTDERHGRFYAMKQITGRTLAELLEERGEETGSLMWLRRLLGIYQSVCETVASAHENGIVHRDLKPGNIMIDNYGSVYVIDWGIAKRIGHDSATNRSRTLAGSVLGSPGYMSPEQADGHAAEVSPAADVFALGVVLYEILTGFAPFSGNTSREAMLKTMHRDPDNPRRKNPLLSRSIVAVCMKALDKDPSRRYRNALGLLTDIQAFNEGRPVSVLKPGIPEKLVFWTRRQPVRAAVTSALTFAAVTAVVVVGFQVWLDHRLADKARDAITVVDQDLEELRAEIGILRVQASAAKGPEKDRMEKELELLKARFLIREIGAVNILRHVANLRFIRTDPGLLEDAKKRLFDTIDTGMDSSLSVFGHALAESMLEQAREGVAGLSFDEKELEKLRSLVREADDAAGLSPP